VREDQGMVMRDLLHPREIHTGWNRERYRDLKQPGLGVVDDL